MDGFRVQITNNSSVVPVNNGGTGLSAAPGVDQILLGDGTGYALKTLIAGQSIVFAETPSSLTISAPYFDGGFY
jgi:hypothetical protein